MAEAPDPVASGPGADITRSFDLLDAGCERLTPALTEPPFQQRTLRPGEHVEGFVEKEIGNRIWIRRKCGKPPWYQLWSGGPFGRCTYRGDTFYVEGVYDKRNLGEADCCGSMQMRVRVIKR